MDMQGIALMKKIQSLLNRKRLKLCLLIGKIRTTMKGGYISDTMNVDK